MKIVLIHGQDHKGSTYNVSKMLIDNLVKETDEVSEFMTNGISSCVGCFSCILKGEGFCPHKKTVQPMIEKIEEADVIIIDSPNYCMGMSGQLKTFFDHMAYRWISHRPHPNMKNKIGVAISTTAGMGAGGTSKSIKKQLFWWGIPLTFRISPIVSAMSWDDVKAEKKIEIKNKTEKIAKAIKRKLGKVKPGIKSKFFFRIMKMQQKNNTWNPVDKKHWEDNGWL